MALVCCFLRVVRCWLVVGCCVLCVVLRLSPVVRRSVCMLFVVSLFLLVGWCVLFVVCWLYVVDCCV